MPLKSFIAYFALLAVAFATGPPAPNHSPAPAYGKVTVYEDGTAVYQYEYALQDDYSGDNIRQNEHRDGYSTGCQYRVLFPDGRTQIVTYTNICLYFFLIIFARSNSIPHEFFEFILLFFLCFQNVFSITKLKNYFCCY